MTPLKCLCKCIIDMYKNRQTRNLMWLHIQLQLSNFGTKTQLTNIFFYLCIFWGSDDDYFFK